MLEGYDGKFIKASRPPGFPAYFPFTWTPDPLTLSGLSTNPEIIHF